MKIVFLSNVFNHHQSALSDALWKLTGGTYVFVQCSNMSPESIALGYPLLERAYVLQLKGNEKTVKRLIEEADIVISGSAPVTFVQQRVRSGKLLFRYSERPLKKGLEPWKYIPRLLRWNWWNPPGKPIYMLCASAYTAGDYRKFGLFKNRCYRWGYFPEVKRYTDIGELLNGKNPSEILWCGRFLQYKHGDDVILAAHKLKEAGYDFTLNFIGQGEMEGKMQELVQQYNLGDNVHFLGSMPPEQVREHMERAGIYLVTSDKEEGWGAVLNESMNSGCAVVASHAIGSVPFLLKNEENGLLYQSENGEMLWEKIRDLLDHPQKQKRLGRAAYETIANEWNAEKAAYRLIRLAESILQERKQPDLYDSGPCSKAEVMDDGWYEA